MLLKVLKNINIVKVVIFEHHYDLMISKNYHL